MFYLKLTGRIVAVNAVVVTDRLAVQSLREGFSKGFVDKNAIKGERLFIESGLLMDETFGYYLELVEIGNYHLDEVVLKPIHLSDANVFFTYPLPYCFTGDELLVYEINEFTGSLYAAVTNISFKDFDVSDLYLGEVLLDDEMDYGGILSKIYYIPLGDAQKIVDSKGGEQVRKSVVNILKNGKAKDFRHYKHYVLDLKVMDGEYKHFIVRDRKGEVYNDWVD